nr:MAG TPA: hypothetical protein [Caudoviricetes sp.]
MIYANWPALKVFYSSVILNSTEICRKYDNAGRLFYSSVILNSTEIRILLFNCSMCFTVVLY